MQRPHVLQKSLHYSAACSAKTATKQHSNTVWALELHVLFCFLQLPPLPSVVTTAFTLQIFASCAVI